MVLLGRWQKGLLHLHELESEYTKHFNLHPSHCLTTVEYLLVGSWYPFSIWYHLNLPPSSPCTMSLSIPSPRNRQHNCKHIYYTLESHTSPPHISFYCVAPVFCFHFLRTSNKALISFKKQEGELVLPSSERAGSSRGGNAGRFVCFTPWQWGNTQRESLLLLAMVCSAPSEGLTSVLHDFFPLFLGCWTVVCILWSGDGGSRDLFWKVDRIHTVPMAKNHCLVKSHVVGLTQERNSSVIWIPIIKCPNF